MVKKQAVQDYAPVTFNLDREIWERVKEEGKKWERDGGAQLRFIIKNWFNQQTLKNGGN